MDNPLVPDNPLVSRYATPAMIALWSPQRRHGLWRRVWLALAENQSRLDLRAADGKTPRIRPDQLAAMRAHLDDIDFKRAAQHERDTRHDVMAHIKTFADACPEAADIIHLGATSCDITDNADLLQMREGLSLLRDRLVGLLAALARFAQHWKAFPTLGFTHYQPAQLTTVGKRACLWLYDFLLDFHEIEQRLQTLHFRGIKGATGTQNSFLELFNGDGDKVKQLEAGVAKSLGFDLVYPVTGQTYSRKIDTMVLDTLSGLAQSAHKWGSDLRLLAHDQEIEEPHEKAQVGSSAMPYKSNPMRAERLCGLARYLMALPASAAHTAASQWLERTLDDSSNRRLILPGAFLTADSLLTIGLNLVGGLHVNEDVIRRRVEQMAPFVASENLLMRAVAAGGNRQELHEVIRVESYKVSDQLKAGAMRNDLFDRLRQRTEFTGVDFGGLTTPAELIGRAPQQVDEFLSEHVEPVLRRFEGKLQEQRGEVRV